MGVYAMRIGHIGAAAALCLAALCLAGCGPALLPPVQGTGTRALSAFGFLSPPVQAIVTEETRTVSLKVPARTDCTSLVAVFVISGTRVTVAGVEQESGKTANNFERPVEYVVELQDGSRVTYVVHVSVEPPLGQAKSLSLFSFVEPPVSAVIDESSHTISAVVPRGTDVSSLVAVFAATGVLVTVDDTEQQSGVTINDFTEPVAYTVTAEDGSTACYLVSVSVAPSGEKQLTSFSFQCPGSAAVINEGQRIVRARVPAGTDVTALIASFVTTGVSVRAAGAAQESGITANDFSAPVDYEVIAEDGSFVIYSVRVADHIGLLINELDVDQVGLDTAEYIELLATDNIDPWGISVVLINGGVTPGQEYGRIDLSSLGALAQGTCLVLAGPMVQVPTTAVKYTPPGWESSNRIQNGPSDAVLLWDSIGRKAVDSVSYAGVLRRALIAAETAELDATEGEAGAPADSNSAPGSIGRFPSGQDTGQNGLDFRFSPVITPGLPNQ
jgi:hypothetical protein